MISIKTNFSFQIPTQRLITELCNRAAKDAKTQSKQKIDEQNFEPLSEKSTLPLRRERGNDSTTILKDTGGAYDSMHSEDNGLTFNKYLNYHNKARTAGGMFKGALIPERKWLVTKLTKNNVTKFFADFRKAMRKI